MANERLFGPAVRFGIASPFAFADWQNPTVAEMNAASSTDPYALIFDLTCALSEDGTEFNLGESDTDDELSFCQTAGSSDPTAFNPEIVFSFFRAQERWLESEPATLNLAELTFSLLRNRGMEYFFWCAVGPKPGELFKAGDQIKMARMATDFAVDEKGVGENIKMSQTPGFRSDLAWNRDLVA